MAAKKRPAAKKTVKETNNFAGVESDPYKWVKEPVLHCPYCASTLTRVTSSPRLIEHLNRKIRYRICIKCANRFGSYIVLQNQ